MTPELWQNESGFLTDKAKDWIERLDSLSDEELLTLFRELEGLSRLIWGRVYCSPSRLAGVKKVALACTINYLQTPVEQYGYIPPAAVSIQASCIMAEDFAKVNGQKAPATTSITAGWDVDLEDVPDF